jgi:hypothetical protein
MNPIEEGTWTVLRVKEATSKEDNLLPSVGI